MKDICLSCNSEKIISKNSFKNIKLVSSDTLPINYKFAKINICAECGLIQKKISHTYLKNISKIYNNYKTFHQEKKKIGQSIFDSKGISLSRSQIIFDYLFSKIKTNYKKFNILDYGCGSGINMIHLRKFINKKNIFGYEKFVRKSTIIEKYLLNKIYDDKIFKKKFKFDLIVSIFILEHVLDPKDYFLKISNLLSDKGLLLLQVPDIDNNPYDFAIYDHTFHFSLETLKKILQENNFKIVYISNRVVRKEITCIAIKNNHKISYKVNQQSEKSKKIVKNAHKFLLSNLNLFNRIIKKNKKIIIFGSSISAIWIYNNFKKYIYGFVDEDQNRIGRKVKKLIIFNINDKKITKYPIFIPLMPNISKLINKRYPTYKFYYVKKYIK